MEGFLKPSERQADPESITDEERFMFRKLGLRMKAFLLLGKNKTIFVINPSWILIECNSQVSKTLASGRRGVFDGTVENMHLHWKYRELVKIILKAKSFEQVKKIALALEAESGGVLVSVDKISKGYAIIVYRGKDYQRPSMLRPKNLLTKRKALARSIEIQRSEVSFLNLYFIIIIIIFFVKTLAFALHFLVRFHSMKTLKLNLQKPFAWQWFRCSMLWQVVSRISLLSRGDLLLSFEHLRLKFSLVVM